MFCHDGALQTGSIQEESATMSARSAALATRLEQANQEVIDVVAGAQDDKMADTCPAEGWTAAALGSHIGFSHVGIVEGLVKPVVEGRPLPPVTMSDFAEGNAKHALEHSAMPRDQVLTLLRDNGATAAAYVRSLSDDDLDRTATLPVMGDRPVTAEQVIEMILIGHPVAHGLSLRQGLE
jgi:hypothetical protein